jgi:hypothetical protein
VVRDCDTGMYAASAKERAIACLSMVTKSRPNINDRGNRSVRALRETPGIPAERNRGAPPATHPR